MLRAGSAAVLLDMRRVVIVALVAATAGYAYLPADARVARACHLVRDAANDTTIWPPQAGVPSNEPQLDIVAADVAANSKWVTAAIDVRSLASASSPASAVIPGLWRWSFRFTAGGTTYMFHGRLGEGGLQADAHTVQIIDDSTNSWVEEHLIPARTTLDYQRNQVRITVARADLDTYGGVAIGQRLTNLHAYTWHEHTAYTSYFDQPGGEYDIADFASSTASYVAGTPSCVTPGT